MDVASPCSSARGARAASRTRGQTSGSAVPAANASYGSRQNPAAMEGARGALLPITASFCLRALKPVAIAEACLWRLQKVQAEVVGWSFLPGEDDPFGLHHDEKM